MTWTQIRAHYARAFHAAKARGQTQTTIAQRGGLLRPDGTPKQNTISRLLATTTGEGPPVETLVRAVEGLGISVSAFFLAVETDNAQPLLEQIATRSPDATDQWHKVARLLRQLRHALHTIEHARRPR